MELVVRGRSIKTTAEHPFYIPAQGKFVPAGELKAGDELVSHTGELVRIDSISLLGEITTVYNLRVADHHTYFVGGGVWQCDVWVHNAQYGFKSLTRKQQIAYLHGRGIPGADQLLSKMNSSGNNVRQGAYFQAKRAVAYYLSGKLQAIEHAVNDGSVDLLLKTGMQVENKSWWKWDSIGDSIQESRLATLTGQMERYLESPGSRLRIEFDTHIYKQVEEHLIFLQELYGDRLTWKTI